jgi:hypothetical protein
MAIEKVINIVANAKQATSEIKALYDNLLKAEIQQDALNESAEDMEKAYNDSTKAVKKDIDSVGQSAKKQSGIVSGLKNSVQAVGTALKALGIGIIIALVAKFTMVLSENKKVMDFVSSISNTLSIVMNQLITSFISITEKIYEATGGFDALTTVVGSALKIAFNNLKIVVLQLQGGFTALKLAYEKVFGDDEGVEKAKKDLVEIGTKLQETLKDNVKQGKNIINNIGEAVNEVVTGVTTLVSEGSKAISEIDLKSAYAQGQAITRSKNNFELLALQQQRMQLLYQFQSEALRQVRDDDTKAISERIKANEDLGAVLKKQFEAESATIVARRNSLQQEQNLLGFTVERQNEIYQLNTDLIDVAERLKGVESEQLSNKNALLREQIDLQNTIFENENSRQLAQLDFEASIAKTEEDKLAKQRERLELENKLIEEDLETKRGLYALGTQARVDAEQEFLNKKQEIDNNLKLLDIEAEKNEKEKAKRQIEIDNMVKDAKIAIADNTLNLISEIAGKGSKVGKAIAVAQATISGIQGVQSAFTTASASPITTVFPAYPFIQAGLAGVFSMLQIKKILSTDASGKSSPSPTNTGGGGGGASAPSFNLVAGTGTNQIAQSLAGQNQPLQAFVVGSAVTSQQELDRNQIDTASL